MPVNLVQAILIGCALGFSATSGVAANRTLVLLQENSGRSYLNDLLDGPAEVAAQAIVDGAVEQGEASKFAALAQGHYQRFVNLSDANCTRANLLSTLIAESVAGYTVDLAILGHGNTNLLALHDGELLLGGPPFRLQSVVPGRVGFVRTLLSDARARQGAGFKFSLRLVHMCNCVAGSLNDDWLAIGARVSVGSRNNDYMPEPMNTFFWNDFLNQDKRVSQAASDSYAASVPLWQTVPGYNIPDSASRLTKIQESRQVVAGDGNLIFKDECLLAPGESRTFSVFAKRTHTFPGIYLVAGQRYKITAHGNWKAGAQSPVATPNGYVPGFFDAARRYPYNVMCLVGERFRHDNDPLAFVNGSGFRIGSSRTLTAGHGFLNLFANDAIFAYGDNTGVVTVTVKRLP